MKENNAKIVICHHPASLLLYKNLVKIIRRYDKEIKIILFKVNHPYFLKFNFKPYQKYFDEIIEFDFINYRKNFFLGYWEIFNFKRGLKKATADLLTRFKTIDLFLADSAWLPVNILLYNLSKQKNIKNITKLGLAKSEFSQTKTDDIRSFLYALYSSPFKCYKVKVITTLGGKFVNFVYTDNTPGTVLSIVSPTGGTLDNPNRKKEKFLPYPVIPEDLPAGKKNMVIIFGDTNIPECYSEYLPDRETFVEKLRNFFKVLEKKYSDCKLYYKPHPSNKEQFMPGINTKKYKLFNNSINTETIIDLYGQRIKAVYSFSSTSTIMGSFFGIPSYTFYRYVCNKVGIERFDNFFNQDNIKSKFIFHISDLKEIGKIDNLKRPKFPNLNNIDKRYRKLLRV